MWKTQDYKENLDCVLNLGRARPLASTSMISEISFEEIFHDTLSKCQPILESASMHLPCSRLYELNAKNYNLRSLPHNKKSGDFHFKKFWKGKKLCIFYYYYAFTTVYVNTILQMEVKLHIICKMSRFSCAGKIILKAIYGSNKWVLSIIKTICM